MFYENIQRQCGVICIIKQSQYYYPSVNYLYMTAYSEMLYSEFFIHNVFTFLT